MGGKVATGDTSNLSSGRDLSTTFLQIGENNFSFFSCHARKPYSHKGFRRLQAGKLSGKIFPLGHQIRRSATRKATRGNARRYVPRDKPKRETQGERSREGMDREGMKGKELTGINTMGTYPLALLNIRNNPLGASLAGIADRLPC
jgi:hypothetical protein